MAVVIVLLKFLIYFVYKYNNGTFVKIGLDPVYFHVVK